MAMSRSGERAARALPCSLLLALFVLLMGAPAQAANYTVWSCKTPSGTPTSTEGWAAILGLPSMAPTQNCGLGGSTGSLTSNFAASPATFSGNQRMGWEFTAPTDTTVTEVRANWGYIVGHNGQDTNASAAVGIYRDGFDWPADLIWECQAYFWGDSYCYSGGGVQTFAINATRFGFDAGCYGTSNGTCGPSGDGKSVIGFHDTRITLDDQFWPEFSSLAGVPTGAAKGALEISATLTDRGGGLWQSEVKLGSVVLRARSTLDAAGGRCAEVNVEPPTNEFGFPQPCPRSLGTSWLVDTTTVPDGQHTLSITVWDAAGNATKVVNQTIAVDNVPNPTPTPTPTAVATPTPPPSVTTPTPTPAVLSEEAGARISLAAPGSTVALGREVPVSGRVTTTAGTPIAAATIAVREQATFAGAGVARSAEITTDASGNFTYVARALSSRAITFAYAPGGRSTALAATATYELKVRTKLAFSASRTTAPHGSRITFSGRVLTEPLPSAGAQVLIEVRVGGKWRAAKLLRTAADGTFRWSRRLRAITTYGFRARVLRDAEFPGEPAASKSLRVRLT